MALLEPQAHVEGEVVALESVETPLCSVGLHPNPAIPPAHASKANGITANDW